MTPPACSVASEEAEEPLAGTAIDSVDRWLLIEVNQPWAPKPLESDAFSPEVRAHLDDLLTRLPRSRLQLVRRPGGKSRHPFVAWVRADHGTMSRIPIDRYDDLVTVGVDTLEENAEPAPAICLVCTHGRRDACCGRQGSAFFRALGAAEVELWQTSHLGGHRFAACTLWLPDGLMYGRLRPEHAESWLETQIAGELGDLDRFRGRCAYDQPTQAAEIFLRRRLGEATDLPLPWVSTERRDQGLWESCFQAPTGPHRVLVRREATGATRPESCGKPAAVVKHFVEVPSSH